MKTKKKYSFFVSLTIALVTIVVIVFCAYLALDKLIVPKYFKDYGIYNMHDLVGMVKTLYNSPKEEDMITNGYKLSDQRSAVKKLIDAGVPTLDDDKTKIDYVAVAEELNRDNLKEGDYYFTDRQIAGILDEMLDSKILESKLPDIRYLDLIKINILELIIQPKQIGEGDDVSYSDTSASVSFTFKLDTESVRNQMADYMDTPVFLLNMIVPKTLYITVNYNLEQSEDGRWSVDNGHMALNGRTEKDSEILLNLLIKFIFPPEYEMTRSKLSSECGSILVEGLELLGNTKVYTSGDDHGFILTL